MTQTGPSRPSPPAPQPGATRLGLRERKKLETRLAIQDQALRLFVANGYAATTVDQVAEAAGVSPATFFRYFPTKEDAVLFDSLDPVMIEILMAQPASMRPLAALRSTLTQMLEQISPEEREREQTRQRLVSSVPELRARQLDAMAQGIELLADAMAEREGLERGHPRSRAWAGAVVGVVMAMYLADPSSSFMDQFDGALSLLEEGLF
jgi:AcrR family transcriptional regulator